MNARVAVALVALYAVPIPFAAAGTAEREWQFEVFLDDKPIGYHHFRLSTGRETQRLLSEAHLRVKVLGLTLYTYSHRSLELWQHDCLESIDASTDDNGSESRVRGVRRSAELLLEDGAAETGLSGCVMSFAYWNPAILQQRRLLNAQTGEYLAVEVARLGQSTLEVGGHPVPARHFRIATDERDIELWYSGDDDWIGLRSTTRDGRELRYRRVSADAQVRSAAGD